MPEACPILLSASARTAPPAVPSASLSAEGAAGPMRARVHAFSTLQGPFRTIFMRGAIKGGKSKVLFLMRKEFTSAAVLKGQSSNINGVLVVRS